MLIQIYHAILCGLLLCFSFPNFIISGFSRLPGYLAFISLLPILFIAKNNKPFKSFWLGWLAGFVFFCGFLYWIASISELGMLAPFVLIILSLYLGLYIAVFSLIVSFLQFRTLNSALSAFYRAVLFPSVWVILEFIRGHFLSGFPWGILGYSQYLNLSIIQISSITGVYGISFLIVLVNTSISEIASWADFKKSSKFTKYFTITAPLILIIIFILYGNIIQVNTEKQLQDGRVLKSALIQGNIKQDEKWIEDNIDNTFETYSFLSNVESPVDLIIWPETAAPLYLKYQPKYSKIVCDIAKRQKSYLLTGTLDALLDKDKNERHYNSVFLFSPEGEFIGKYDKIHLVPFGEFTPLKNYIKFLEKFTVGFRDYSSGSEYTVFKFNNIACSVLICYEGIFPELVRRFSAQNVDFLVNITNDAWYKKTAMSYQHTSMLVFRSVENRLWSLRAANTGVSCFISPSGQIENMLDIFQKGNVVKEIKVKALPTFYKSHGDVFALFCLIVIAVILAYIKIWKI